MATDPWPPPEQRIRLEAIARARSWYSGEDLAEHSGVSFWRKRKDDIAKWNDGHSIEEDEKVHVPAAADLALTASDFLFGGGVEYLVPSLGDTDTTAAMQRLVAAADEAAGLTALLPLAGEKASGLGEVYIRLGWSDSRPAMATLVDPDRVLPTFRWGRMVSAQVWTDLPDHQSRKWRHVETYDPGKITHRLFRSSSATETRFDMDGPGEELDGHPATEGLEGEVALPDALRNRLALLYVANADPRTLRIGGRSDTEGSEDLMAGLDLSISSLLRDVDLGKARILVDESMLSTSGNLGKFFDNQARAFAALQAGGIKGADGIKFVQAAIRAQAHLATASDLLHRLVSAGGYSPESLSVVQSGLPESAAARRARERASLRTTERKATRWRPVLAEAYSSLAVVLDPTLPAPPPVTVALRSSLSPDTMELAASVSAAFAAGIMSPQTAIRELHPTWTEAQVLAEVERLPGRRPLPSPDGQ